MGISVRVQSGGCTRSGVCIRGGSYAHSGGCTLLMVGVFLSVAVVVLVGTRGGRCSCVFVAVVVAVAVFVLVGVLVARWLCS